MLIDLKALTKSSTDRQWDGVCGGLGEHTPWPTWLWRALFVLSALCYGAGLVIYLVLAAYMPSAAAKRPLTMP
ncbi:MAG: PspC domain-containing protein [Xanthomonadaceae bacterium]|nr:PspC domain-containing protein [Xanthomonadaceae bacterium]